MTVRAGSLWGALGSSVSRVLQFLAMLVLARLLMPEDFGLIATVQSVTGLLGMAITNGWDQALVRRRELEPLTRHTVFSFQLVSLSLAWMLLFFSADFLGEFLGDARYAAFLPVAGLGLLIRPFWSVPHAIAQRRMAFDRIAQINIMAAVVPFVVTMPMAWLGFGAWSLVAGQLVASAASAAAMMAVTGYRPRLAFSWARFLSVFSISHRFVGLSVLGYLTNWGPFAILSRMLGPVTVGLFQRGLSTAQIPMELAEQSLVPPLFRAFSKGDAEQRARHLLRALAATTLYLWPVAYLLHAHAEQIIVLLYGGNWAAAGSILSVLAWCILAFSLTAPSRTALAATTSLAYLLLVRLVATLSILGLFWFHASDGVEWISRLYVAIFLLEAGALLLYTVRKIGAGLLPVLRSMLPPAAGLAVMHGWHLYSPLPDTVPAGFLEMGMAGVLYGLVVLSGAGFNEEARFIRRRLPAIFRNLRTTGVRRTQETDQPKG